MNTLASSHLFFTHGAQTLFIIAIIFTLIGLIVGRMAWYRFSTQATKVERMNNKLKEEYQLLKVHNK